jgi:hypothetical protein
MSREKEQLEDEITERLPESELDTLEIPLKLPTGQAAAENSNKEVDLLRLQLQECFKREQLLKDELVEAKYKTRELTHPDLPNEIEEQILIVIGQQDGSCNITQLKDRLEHNLHTKGKEQINQVILDSHLHKVEKQDYLSIHNYGSPYEPISYSLTDKGREYLIANKLL